MTCSADSIRHSCPVLAADLHSFRRQRGGSFFNSFISSRNVQPAALRSIRRPRWFVFHFTDDADAIPRCHQAGVKPTGDDYVKFQAARDKKGSAEVKDAATERDDSFTDVDVKMNDPNAWSQDQTKALAAAIEAVPKTAAAKDADRWKMIATAVPGKDAKQCFTRYKEMKEAHKAAKA